MTQFTTLDTLICQDSHPCARCLWEDRVYEEPVHASRGADEGDEWPEDLWDDLS